VTGEIISVHFRPGQDVKKGDLLFKIDARPFEADLRQAESNLERNQALLENARSQARRFEQLAEQGIVARQLAEERSSTAEALESAVRADRAAVENAKLRLSYCDIFAPMDGRTGSLLIHAGSSVRANENPPLVVINQISPAYVEFAVPEQNLPVIQRQMAGHRLLAEAVIPNDSKPVRGTLTFVDNAVDRSTGTIRLRATFDNEDARLWPGQFVSVTLTLVEQSNAIVVLSQAVQSGQSGTYVYVVKPDETVEMRPVTVSRSHADLSVIDSGLQAGETVVLEGQLSLVPNARVSIKGKQ
jgi:multidrug efflux system membrane fusion protein